MKADNANYVTDDGAAPDPYSAWVCRTRVRADDPGAINDGVGSGRLAGVRVGVKDVIVTAELPTRFGSAVPAEAFEELLAVGDADCVRLLRAEGAVIAGKTVTAELATYSPGATVNPRAPEHTPGGSSSGSAAAVSAGDVPLALATQTAGSVIRPASFCGVFGFKPSFNRYSTRGVLTTSPSLDTLGMIATNPSVLAIADAVLSAVPPLATRAPSPRRLVLYRTGHWEQATNETRALIEEHFARWQPLFDEAEARPPQPEIEALFAVQRIVHCGEVAQQLGWLVDRFPSAVSEPFRKMVGEGRSVLGDKLDAARDTMHAARDRVSALFPADEIWLTPAARGPAPRLAEGTGDPLFSRPWTALGVPCATLPSSSTLSGSAATAQSVLPIGVQLMASTGRDRMLLDTLARLAADGDRSESQEEGR